jgi:hypothetical protein
MTRRGQGVDDDLVNLGLILVAAAGLIAAIMRLAGSVAAWLSDAEHPNRGWEAGFRVLRTPSDPASALGAPGLVPWMYWLVLILMVVGVVACVLVVWQRIGTIKHTTSHDPRRLAGMATRRDVRAVASPKALRERGRTLRPSLSPLEVPTNIDASALNLSTHRVIERVSMLTLARTVTQAHDVSDARAALLPSCTAPRTCSPPAEGSIRRSDNAPSEFERNDHAGYAPWRHRAQLLTSIGDVRGELRALRQ